MRNEFPLIPRRPLNVDNKSASLIKNSTAHSLENFQIFNPDLAQLLKRLAVDPYAEMDHFEEVDEMVEMFAEDIEDAVMLLLNTPKLPPPTCT